MTPEGLLQAFLVDPTGPKEIFGGVPVYVALLWLQPAKPETLSFVNVAVSNVDAMTLTTACAQL
jgi:hypothetical protein